MNDEGSSGVYWVVLDYLLRHYSGCTTLSGVYCGGYAMKVLIACEFSGIMRDAFTARGHEAWSCDLLPSETEGLHFEQDVATVLDLDWDLIIAHPPCTYLANSGVQHLRDPKRWYHLHDAVTFFRLFTEHDCPRICIENPIPHKYGGQMIGRKYDQLIQPWQYGHGESKATCLWLKGLPKLEPTNIVEGREQRIWKMSPGPDRAKLRSITYQGIADAMADQWY